MKNIKFIPPEEIEFVAKKVYYVKLKKEAGIQPLYCTDGCLSPYSPDRFPPNSRILDRDIAYVVTGVKEGVLHRAYQEKLFGRRNLEALESGRTGDVGIPEQGSSQGRET